MHLLGGAVVALAYFSIASFRIPLPQRFFGVWYVLASVFVVGIVWEVFELYANLEQTISIDTYIDLVMDMIGGGIGYFVASRTNDL